MTESFGVVKYQCGCKDDFEENLFYRCSKHLTEEEMGDN